MLLSIIHCAIPEKIHTDPMKGHQKFLVGGGGGGLKAKILEATYQTKLEIIRGRGCKTKTFHGGSMDNF